MDNIKWYIGQKVFLSRKKDNGHPRHRNIGEELEVVDVNLNPKCPRLCIRGNRSPGIFSFSPPNVGDYFWLHIKYVKTLDEAREERLIEIIEEDSI